MQIEESKYAKEHFNNNFNGEAEKHFAMSLTIAQKLWGRTATNKGINKSILLWQEQPK